MNGMEPQSPEPAAAPPEDSEAAEAKPQPRMLLRCAWALTGVVLPFICFVIGFPGRPSWQSGNLRDYAALLMSHTASLPMYPLLLFSMVCLLLLTVRSERFARNGWIWLGIFSGVVLSIEYWIVFVAAINDMADGWGHSEHYVVAFCLSAIAVAVPWFGCLLFMIAFRRLARGENNALPVILILVGCLVLAIVLLYSIPYVIMLCLFCSTPWAVAAYASAAVWLIRQRGKPYFRYTLAQLLTAMTALAANFAAWRTAYQIMLTEYARLPTVAPQECFVCSAAARGHASVVGSTSYRSTRGESFIVNDQLRTLKAFELLLLALSPAAHRVLRRVYNCIGPRLAAALFHPLAADAAYFALKPIEWSARFLLRIVLGKHVALIARLYRV
jgi:hypothetical protein